MAPEFALAAMAAMRRTTADCRKGESEEEWSASNPPSKAWPRAPSLCLQCAFCRGRERLVRVGDSDEDIGGCCNYGGLEDEGVLRQGCVAAGTLAAAAWPRQQ
jgi:hypothetical protein